MIALNEDINNNLINILDNYSNINNKYGLSKRDIESIISVKTGIKYDKVLSLLRIYNDFYNNNFQIENIFNISYIKNYHEYKNKVNIEYGNNEKNNFIDKFLTIKLFQKVFNKIKNTFENKYLLKDKKLAILIFIILLFIIFIIFNLYNKNILDNNTSSNSNRIQQIINN